MMMLFVIGFDVAVIFASAVAYRLRVSYLQQARAERMNYSE